MVSFPFQHFVGIDISARTADVVLLAAQGDVLATLSIEQSSVGYRRVQEALTKLRVIPE